MGVGGGARRSRALFFFIFYREGGPEVHEHITATLCRIDNGTRFDLENARRAGI